MSVKSIEIPVKDVPRGIELCLTSSERFLRDAATILGLNPGHSAAILALALEELGKARMLRDKAQGLKPNQNIVFHRNKRNRFNEFYDHAKKLAEGKSLLPTPDVLMVSSARIGRAQIEFFAVGQQDVVVSHTTRLDAFFVDYVAGDWKYDVAAAPSAVKNAIEEVKKAIVIFHQTISGNRH